MRVAQAAGDAQRIGQLEDVVREQRPVAAALVVHVAQAADVAHRAQPVDPADDRRPHRRGQRGAPGGAQAAGIGRVAQRRGRIDRRDHAARRERAILRSELQVVDDLQVLVRVIAAHQPVEPPAEQPAAQPGFLREGMEFAIGVAVVGAIADVDVAIVDVGRAAGLVLTIRADRDQLDAADVPADARRHAVIGGDVRIGAAARVGDQPVVRIARAGQHAAQALQHRHDAVLRRNLVIARRARRRIELLARVDIDRAAALLVAMRIVADQPDREIGGRFEEQLPAHEIAVAVVIVCVVDDIVVEAVALGEHAVDAERQLVGHHRPGQRTGQPHRVEIAVGRLAVTAEGEVGIFGVDADRAGGRIAPRQRALRPAQHFDPLHLAQVVQPRSGAAAIHAVDEHRDRAFQPRVVAHRTDAAQPRGRIGFRSGRRHDQRRRQLRHLADVGRARILQRGGAIGADRDRHVRQSLRPARRGDDDVGGVGGGGGRGLRAGCLLLLGGNHLAQPLRRRRSGSGQRDRSAGGGRQQTSPLPHLVNSPFRACLHLLPYDPD